MPYVESADLLSTATGKGTAMVGWAATGTGAVDRTLREKLKEYCPISPEDFGAVGNGSTDDTGAVLAWAAAIGNHTRARADGVYLVGGLAASAAVISNKTGFLIEGSGTFRIASGTATIEANSAFRFENCTNFLVEGIQIDGNRSNRTPLDANGLVGSGHLIIVRNCQRATFRRVHADNGTTDGFYIASAANPAESELPADLLFADCYADNNFRQGMSIVEGYNITVRGGRYSNTAGAYFADPDGSGPLPSGHGPCAGIDIEPDDQPSWIQNRINGVLIDGVTFDGNDGFGLLVTHVNGVRNVVSRDCKFLNNKLGAIQALPEATTIVRPYIEGWDNAVTPNATKRGCIDIPLGAERGITIEHPVFRGISATSSSLFLIYAHSNGSGGVRIYDMDVDASAIGAVFLNAPNCRVDGGRLVGVTKSDGIDLAGANSHISRVYFSGCAGTNARVQGARSSIAGCEAIEPTGTNAVFRAVSAGATIDNNLAYRATAAAGTAYLANAAPRSLQGNTSTGFTTVGFSITGTPLVKRGNVVDGVLQPETAIVP